MEQYIEIKGAKANNLKNIDVNIPRNQLVVITGLSGSGKSSLAFDTLYADGQRRYVESLSAYARQFMGKLSKPEVEYIKGIPPAIAIEQRVASKNPRSTVGTSTEIFEYIKLLFARIGKTFSPISGQEVKKDDLADVINYIEKLNESAIIYIMAPLTIVSGRELSEQLEILKKQGYSRLVVNKELLDIDDFMQEKKVKKSTTIYLFIDRFKVKNLSTQKQRVSDSIQTAFSEGKEECLVQIIEDEKIAVRKFNNKFELDDITFEIPTPHLFSFNNPYGACPHCEGIGVVEGISKELVFPDTRKSLFDGAAACWKGEKMKEYKELFIKQSRKIKFPIHKPIAELSPEQFDMLWKGDEKKEVIGILPFFAILEAQQYKIQNKIMLSRFRGRVTCPKCNGTRVRHDANYVKVNNKTISDIVTTPIDRLYQFFKNFEFQSKNEEKIAKQLLTEIKTRLEFLLDVGLGYLTLNRLSHTLSGGEGQRINLATSLGSSLVGSLYILDEPSIGLHPRDTEQLIKVLKRLRDIGNTVVVVEHDEDIIANADYIIDLGPKAGRLGGQLVFEGTFKELLKSNTNLTSLYIKGIKKIDTKEKLSIPLPQKRRPWRNKVTLSNANINNLKNITVNFPLHIFTVVTGVSGSGKSSLVKDILYPELAKKLSSQSSDESQIVSKIKISTSSIKEVIFVDQNPIGKSTRSNPATYIKVYEDIRELYAAHPLAKQRNYKPGFFSFNVAGGRCDACEGEGVVHVEMQFMADVILTCPNCNGTRFKDEVLDIKINENSIADVLNMTINQSREFFETLPKSRIIDNIIFKLNALQEVGLGYLKMGQSSSTLSGGEAQRVKLAYYLTQGTSKSNHIFIFDEPTTGLHFHDINALYHAFNKLIEIGNSIILIEHNMELIKCADWIIDLGPGGGENGGTIVFEGTPEEMLKCKNSQTALFLKEKL